MELIMYIGIDRIASLPVDRQLISQPGYISGMKRRLAGLTKEQETDADIEPEFLLSDGSLEFNLSAAVAE